MKEITVKPRGRPKSTAETPVGHYPVKDVATRYGINLKSIQKRISRGTLPVLRKDDRVYLGDTAVSILIETYVANPSRNRFK